MRRLLALLLLLAACQMQGGKSDAPPDVAGLSEETIAVTPLDAAPQAASTPAETKPEPAKVAQPVAEPIPEPIPVQTPDASTPRPKLRPAVPPAPTKPDAAKPDAAQAPAALIPPEMVKCEKSGGQWATVGTSGRICVFQTRDAGKICRKKSDCKGECLAQSGTCSPITPLMGCNSVLDDQGRTMTQCLQ